MIVENMQIIITPFKHKYMSLFPTLCISVINLNELMKEIQRPERIDYYNKNFIRK